MVFLKRTRTLSIVLLFLATCAKAQDSAIGYWESHLPYSNSVGVATNGRLLYNAGVQGFYTHDPTGSNPPVPYSKVEGMSDIGMQCIGYDIATSTAVLVYANGNIDLFKDNTFYNVPDLKIKSVSGTKQVYQIYTENGLAYLSTSLGVLIIDLTKHTITQTYQFVDPANNNETIPVKSFTSTSQYFYAATSIGLYRGDRNNPQLQNFQVWKKIDSTHALTNMASVNNALFFSTISGVYIVSSDTLKLAYTPAGTIQHLDAGISNVFISEYNDVTFLGKVKTMNAAGAITDTVAWAGKPLQVVQTLDSTVWIADFFSGLSRRIGDGIFPYVPAGPTDPSTFDIFVSNKKVYVAHGSYTNSNFATYNHAGIDYLADGKWTTYNGNNYPPLNDLPDFVTVIKDEAKGTLYCGSFLGGLFTLNTDGTYGITSTAVFDSSSSYFGQGQRQITGLALDHSSNLWVTTYGSQHILYAKSADSTWYKFTVPNSANGGPVVIDDNDQVWFVCYANGNAVGGVSVYNYNGTLSDQSDDASYHLYKGPGAGNLPSNNVLCIAKDNNNNIWVGTDNGIGIISNCSAPFAQTPPCDAEIPIVQYDQYAGYLFAGNAVNTIAVDGANRKWIGTDAGVWLLSPDASKIVYRFTVDNSPLPSNNVQKIAVDQATGDVYIGTELGMVTYRSTAVKGNEENSNVLVFPNPVKTGYSGPIAIKGLVTNADVRITDVSGQLVYHTTAFGGQATWNGLDYKGRRPQSGVYLIFATNNDGTQTYSGKLVFMQ